MSTTAPPGAGGRSADPLAGLVDDAAIFPPGNASMTDALRDHALHRDAWYTAVVGSFVCSDARLPQLQGALTAAEDVRTPLHVSLTITGGAGAIEPALTWVARDERLALSAVEVALRDEADLAHNAGRMTTVLAGSLPADVDAYVEMPRLFGTDTPASWLAALDDVAAAGHRVKIRTGGLEPEAFPAATELATVVEACLDRETPFKCTAGLHHAVRHTAVDTGFEHHGFLNVLLATRASLDGQARAEVETLLEERDPARVADQVRGLGSDRLASARRWFRSFGSCSIIEPVDDLVDLDLISKGATT